MTLQPVPNDVVLPIFAIDVGSDGVAWVQAARMDPDGTPLEPIQTYAISAPDA
jgi:hypothetical protein